MAFNMYERVVDVISKPKDLRQDFEVQQLLPWFRKKAQLFQKLKTDILKDLIKNCKFISKIRDEPIIRQGDRGECFYLILRGRISIYILAKDDEDKPEDAEDESKARARRKDEKIERNKLGNFVCHLGPGEPFGDVALLSEDCIRTASVISDEVTDLLVVDRSLYNRSVRDVLAREFERKKTFIENHPLFSNWAPKYRTQLAMAMYQETLPYEGMLVKQGEPLSNIYFILDGEIQMNIEPQMHRMQYQKLFREADQEAAERSLKRTEKARPITEQQYNNVKKRDHLKGFNVCVLGLNEAIGDTEVLLDLDTYLHTGICHARTDVLVLEMKHYDRLLVRRHQRTIDALRENLELKLQTRMALLKRKTDVPLLDILYNKVKQMNAPIQQQSKTENKDIGTVHGAEKEFINHRGPLVDNYGPGSVFYLIRMRENAKLKYRHHKFVKSTQYPAVPQSILRPTQYPGSPNQERINAQDPIHVSNDITDDATNANNSGAYDSSPDSSPRHYQSPTTMPSNSTEWSDEIYDDADLEKLEQRVVNWLRKDNPKGGAQVARLRRLPVPNLDEMPRPGNKVVIRRKKKLLVAQAGDSSSNDDEDNLDRMKVLLSH